MEFIKIDVRVIDEVLVSDRFGYGQDSDSDYYTCFRGAGDCPELTYLR